MPGGPASTAPVCPSGGAGLGIPKDITPEEQVMIANIARYHRGVEPRSGEKRRALTGTETVAGLGVVAALRQEQEPLARDARGAK